MQRGRAERYQQLIQLCQQFDVAILYAFGSRGRDVWEWLHGHRDRLTPDPRDVDVGVKLRPGKRLSVREKVALTLALEDLLDVSRVDLVVLEEADPFLAANIIRGERLYAADDYFADEYELYILRRAGDLAPLERERMKLVLEKPS